jgi:uncharacterized membrane protein YuzA (DUF378 family)
MITRKIIIFTLIIKIIMFTQQNITLLVQLILIAGALNWGLVAYKNMDIVAMLTGGGQAEKCVKYVVAAAGLYNAYQLYIALSK